ncbi:hypothetical protein ACHAQJ_001839, partial [Trichoderma viride]
MPELLELSTLTFKDSPSSPPQSWLDDLKVLASTPGVIALYFGQHIETPEKYSWVARWTAQSAIDDFHNSPGFASWAASFSAPLSSNSISTCADYVGDATIPLESPCTEFFINTGVDSEFIPKRLDPFVKVVEDAKLPGLIGGVSGEYVSVMHVGVEAPEQKVVVLLLGWESRDAHIAQQGKGK